VLSNLELAIYGPERVRVPYDSQKNSPGVHNGDENDKPTKARVVKICLLLLFLWVIAVAVIFCVLYFFGIQDDGSGSNTATPTVSPTTVETEAPPITATPFDPFYPNLCQLSNQYQPHVLSQCFCYGEIRTLAESTKIRYEALVSTFMVPNVYSIWIHSISSCHPANQALVWLSTSNARNDMDLLQRYVLALVFFADDGPAWTSQTKWITDHDICTWHGVVCTGEDIVEINLSENWLNGQVGADWLA